LSSGQLPDPVLILSQPFDFDRGSSPFALISVKIDVIQSGHVFFLMSATERLQPAAALAAGSLPYHELPFVSAQLSVNP
jgi:hypothetical protein